ncbi:hypothetical protein MNBD_PLANCTO02-419 [hydrothermal vent metagenome]|uniref:Uncharacterized protein n=1 Tax=hydrothermal vent metagenome TaxID=652676 RepID=A0A3B1E6X0_9ZZZZ
MAAIPKWINAGDGKTPQLRWSFVTETPLKYLCLARETGESLAGDESGKLYRLNRQGELDAVTGGFSSLNGLVFSDNGESAAVILEDSKLVWLNKNCGVVGSKNFSSDLLSMAIAPYGHLLAVTIDNGSTSIYQGKRNRITNFVTDRPLSYLKFLVTERLLLGASEYGVISLYDLQGDEIWTQSLRTSIGGIAASGDGEQIYLAGFNLGIQKYGSNGEREGSVMIEGTPRLVETSYRAERLAVVTLENDLYWLDDDSKIIWKVKPPEEICNVCSDPLGNWLICGLSTGEIYCFDWRDW